ncbi:unnamed protein product [Ostreobium quekettii]|uniref:Uncharacterized protein n=1 Tax=Ostreobium quekettii TaxID=121088 RepID=A0A8S1J6A5_9CHLO|nr:unnamed protein product [Ostreobium quekettii]|eukprot:evm.model.scf_235.3 EVM.evm.TU.scf_235.3   scf_235:23299-27660(-)
MEPSGMDEDRARFFEEAIVQAKREYDANNNDAQALTRWGGALLELAHFQRGDEGFHVIDEAIQKLEQALKIEPRKHNALWCLGNAFTSKGFLISGDSQKAQEFFDKALDCFKKAESEEPNNDIYRRAAEVAEKAPEIYEELQRQLAADRAGEEIGPAVGKYAEAGSRKPRGAPTDDAASDFWWDAAGWGLLFTIGVTWLLYLQKGAPQK